MQEVIIGPAWHLQGKSCCVMYVETGGGLPTSAYRRLHHAVQHAVTCLHDSSLAACIIYMHTATLLVNCQQHIKSRLTQQRNIY